MAPEPKPSRGMPRSLLYALIPGGFLLLVVLMLVFGRAEQEEAGPPGEVGTTARVGIEELLGQKVFLDLHVKVAKDWQRDPKQLGRLGF